MIVLFLIIGTILFFVFNTLPITKYNHLIALIFLTLGTVSGALIIANTNYHFGMVPKKTITISKLYPSSDKLDTLLYQPVGTDEKVYLYRPVKAKKIKAMKTEKSTVDIKRTHKNSYLKLTTSHYTYRNDIYRLFFGVFRTDKVVTNYHYQFVINDNWYILSTKQAKKLVYIFQKRKQEINSKIKSNVQIQLQQIQKNPNLTPEEKQKLLSKITKQAKKSVLDDLISQTK